MAKGPQFTRYIIPILHALRDMGGSATAAEVTDAVIEREDLPEELLEQTNKNGQSKVRNQIAWARMYLVHSGHIDSSLRGVWRLTERGQHENLELLDVASLFKGVQSTFKGSQDEGSSPKNTASLEAAEIRLEAEETALLPVIKALSADGFERLCQRLLREHGFQNVRITGRSGDGGIDGEGILEINPLLSFKVLFQCKRYQGSVGASMIRDFRGALIGKADKGILLTTGSFTMDAKREAIRDGANPIELVDGEKLVSMFEKLELGVKPKVVYEVDMDFFNDFK
jgi:restriction system protein